MYVIPLGGKYDEFRKNGYIAPKPLIPLHGRPCLFYILDCIPQNSTIVLICSYEFNNYDVDRMIKNEYGLHYFNITIHLLSKQTNGPAETFLMGLKCIKTDIPVLCLDGDMFYASDANVMARWNKRNQLFVFEDDIGLQPLYSYVELNSSGKVCRIVEKECISNLACLGAYGFASLQKLIKTCEEIVKTSNDDMYTSNVIKKMIENETEFDVIQIDENEWSCVGTPLQLRMEALSRCHSNKYRFCFEIDNTLVRCNKDLTLCVPI